MYTKALFALFLVFFHLSGGLLNAQEVLPDTTRDQLATFAETFLRQTKAPGLSIAVRKDGKTLYAEGFGYANLEENIKMNSKIRLRTASVAKVMTATALGILATEGKLDFDAPIKTYIP